MDGEVPTSNIATPPARIETERAAVDSSLEHLRAWMPWAMSEPATLEETKSRLAAYGEAFDGGTDFVYGIFDDRESIVVGGTGLHTRIVEGGLEIGYWIRASETRRGYATEVARALTTAGLGVAGVDRVEIHCDPRNALSRRIPERLGYRLAETSGRGVVFEAEPHLVAKLPDHELWMAFFRDPDHNLLALMAEVGR